MVQREARCSMLYAHRLSLNGRQSKKVLISISRRCRPRHCPGSLDLPRILLFLCFSFGPRISVECMDYLAMYCTSKIPPWDLTRRRPSLYKYKLILPIICLPCVCAMRSIRPLFTSEKEHVIVHLTLYYRVDWFSKFIHLVWPERHASSWGVRMAITWLFKLQPEVD